MPRRRSAPRSSSNHVQPAVYIACGVLAHLFIHEGRRPPEPASPLPSECLWRPRVRLKHSSEATRAANSPIESTASPPFDANRRGTGGAELSIDSMRSASSHTSCSAASSLSPSNQRKTPAGLEVPSRRPVHRHRSTQSGVVVTPPIQVVPDRHGRSIRLQRRRTLVHGADSTACSESRPSATCLPTTSTTPHCRPAS